MHLFDKGAYKECSQSCLQNGRRFRLAYIARVVVSQGEVGFAVVLLYAVLAPDLAVRVLVGPEGVLWAEFERTQSINT